MRAATAYRHQNTFRAITLLVTASILAGLGSIAYAAKPAYFLRGFQQAPLIIDTAERGCILFNVYIAQSPEQRSQGLMHIESMDKYEGMIFLYAEEAPISMWMKNTLISLDMLFIDKQAKITHIHESAEPLSESIIDSGGRVVAVIELNAGASEYFGIKKGDRIIFPAG